VSDRRGAAAVTSPESDVSDALRDLGLEPRSFTPIGGFPRWRPGRVTYRVELASGGVVKVRRLTRPRATTRAAVLLRALDDPDLPAPLFASGRVTVEQWVDGVSLASVRPTARHVEAAADLLGRLHAHAAVPGHPFRRTGSVAPLLAKTGDRLDALQQDGLLTRAEERRLVAELRNGLPDYSARGPVHGDLCAENLVVVPEGRVVSIDNERVRIDFLDYDLARTWVRWPMAAGMHARFERRYTRWGREVPAPPQAAAWRVCAAVKSAFTLRGTPDIGTDLARAQLDRLLEPEAE
jgi:aminoglycoside phosphotransferase (APT) family kinase protein